MVRLIVVLSFILLAAQLGGLWGDETWAVQVAAAYCPPYVYLALWTLAGLALLALRARRGLAIVLVGALVTSVYFDWGWGGAGEKTLRVATFNCRAGTLGVEQLGPLLQSVGPDVCRSAKARTRCRSFARAFPSGRSCAAASAASWPS